MSPTGRLRSVAFVVSICALARHSHADTADHPRVMLSIDGCLVTDPVEVRRIVGVELNARLAEEADTDTTRVRAACGGPNVLLEVLDAITGKSVSRTVNIASAVPSARPRLLALAIVELVSASWTELESNPEPEVPPASAAPSPEARAAALRSVRARAQFQGPAVASARSSDPVDIGAPRDTTMTRLVRPDGMGGRRAAPEGPLPWRVEGIVQGRALLSQSLTSLGFGARLSHHGSGAVGFGVDVRADHADHPVPLGTVSVAALSAAPSAFIEQHWGELALEEGVGLRVGLASFAGTPAARGRAQGGSLLSAWGGPFASVSARVEPVRAFAIEIGGEVGDAPFPARARVEGGGEDVSLEGVWLGGHAGAVLLF